MDFKNQRSPYARFFTRQEVCMLKKSALLQHEADLLRVLICRVLDSLSQADESLSLSEQTKLYSIILRSIATLINLQRGSQTHAVPQNVIAELMENLDHELEE